MKFSIINPSEDDEFKNYTEKNSQANNVLFFDVLRYHSKTIDIRAIPKSPYGNLYEDLGNNKMKHYIKKEVFNISDQATLLTDYRAFSVRKDIIVYTDCLGTHLPFFLNEIIVKCEFTDKPVSNDKNSFAKIIFPSGFHLIEVNNILDNCKTDLCGITIGYNATYFSLLIHNTNKEILAASTIRTEPNGSDGYNFDPNATIFGCSSSSYYVPVSNFSDEEKIVLVSENRCSIEDSILYQDESYQKLSYKFEKSFEINVYPELHYGHGQTILVNKNRIPNFLTRKIIKLIY